MQSELMLAVTAAWTWVDIDIPSMCYAILQKKVNRNEVNKWLFDLVAAIRGHFNTRQPVNLVSADYGIALASPVTYTLKTRGRPPTGPGLNAEIVSTIRKSQLQAAFIRELLSNINNLDILLLPGVFDAFNHVRKTCFPSGSTRAACLGPGNLKHFVEDLKAQPLCHWRLMGASSQLNSGLIAPYDPTGLDARVQPAADQLVNYLRELLPLLSPPLPEKLSELQQRIAGNPDWLLPFRQLAPEVRNAFRSTGILHPSNINKPVAIACLCSCDEWLETYNTLCEDPQIVLFNQGKDRYFCNSRAYGQATGRNVKHARTYFNQEKSWLKLFEGKDSAFKLGYVEAFQFLTWVLSLQIVIDTMTM
ncbi:hypothetical protein C2E23DRAFT_882909 [Lenzites betulinus]|nr:hypothetical protein C2E23DRAFT_882909 [Lenzites betulinus]